MCSLVWLKHPPLIPERCPKESAGLCPTDNRVARTRVAVPQFLRPWIVDPSEILFQASFAIANQLTRVVIVSQLIRRDAESENPPGIDEFSGRAADSGIAGIRQLPESLPLPFRECESPPPERLAPLRKSLAIVDLAIFPAPVRRELSCRVTRRPA